MDSSVSPKDEIWFLRVCHHISNAVYQSFGDTYYPHLAYRADWGTRFLRIVGAFLPDCKASRSVRRRLFADTRYRAAVCALCSPHFADTRYRAAVSALCSPHFAAASSLSLLLLQRFLDTEPLKCQKEVKGELDCIYSDICASCNMASS